MEPSLVSLQIQHAGVASKHCSNSFQADLPGATECYADLGKATLIIVQLLRTEINTVKEGG